MQLSKRTQYGLRAMICLAEAYQRGYLQTKELAAREKLPTKFLESILLTLVRGAFLISKIGASGGYRLARSPKEIRVGEIVACLEDTKFMAEPPDAEPGQRPGEAAVQIVESELSKAVRTVLNAITMAELAERGIERSRGQMYYI